MKILDTSAIMNAHPFRHAYTVPEVIQEIRDLDTKRAVNNLMLARKLVILESDGESRKKVKEAADKTGDDLSRTDVCVLAIAIEKNGIVVTDDYGIQNVAKELGIKFQPVLRGGIRHRYIWKHYCPACRKYRAHYFCDTCGSKTKRRVVSRRR